MRVIHYAESAFTKKQKRSTRWLVETGLIMAVFVSVAALVPTLGVWWHQLYPEATVAPFIATSDPDVAEAQAGPTGSPLLWVMTSGEATVYLFGAFNSTDALASGWIDQRLFKAFDNADMAVFEVGDYPDSLPADKMTLRPDAALFQRAAALRKMTMGLENETALEAGRVTAEGVTDDGFVLPVAAWRTGDQKTLTDTLALLAQADPEGYDALIVKHNQAWLPAIETALKHEGSTFVTVGAAHLIGPDGLVAQLRQRGYEVSRLDLVSN